MLKYKKNLLLLGAGFTASYGGYLGDEMWSKFFNDPLLEKVPEFKEQLRKNDDYEVVYHNTIKNNNVPDNEKKIITEVAKRAYKALDQNIINIIRNEGLTRFHKLFISSFFGNEREYGGVFSLNQDILLERDMNLCPALAPFPDIESKIKEIKSWQKLEVFGTNQECRERFIKLNKNTLFLKLHGSYGWESSNGGPAMIMGLEKQANLIKESLLRWYFTEFKDCLGQNKEKYLVVIGYSFRDRHINDLLNHYVEHSSLKLIIINPNKPSDIKRTISDCSHLWKGVEGYYPYRWNQLFPNDRTLPPYAKELCEVLNIELK